MKYKNLGSAFRGMDADNNQRLDPYELLQTALSQNLNIPKDDLEALVDVLDENKDGLIDFGEFQRGISKLQGSRSSPFGVDDSKVVNKYLAGGNVAGGKQVFVNDNLAVASMSQMRVPVAMELQELPMATDSASQQQMSQYLAELSQRVHMKYKHMLDAFRAMDKDKSGALSKAEMTEAIREFTLPIPLSHVDQLFNEIGDKNGDGFIDYSEFVKLLQQYDRVM